MNILLRKCVVLQVARGSVTCVRNIDTERKLILESIVERPCRGQSVAALVIIDWASATALSPHQSLGYNATTREGLVTAQEERFVP